MNKNTVYILQKDYESPMCKVHKGVGHTIKEWQRYFPKLSEEDFDIKSDWFKPTKDEPQWEILAYVVNNGVRCTLRSNGKYLNEEFESNNNWGGTLEDVLKYIEKGEGFIESVKRFPDNTVWSVDMVTNNGRITGFHIEKGIMVAEFENNTRHCDLMLLIKAPKEEQVPIKVAGIGYSHDNQFGRWYHFGTSKPIEPEKYTDISKAIEDVLNNKYKPWKMYQTGFTSEELLQAIRDAFHAGRSFDCWNVSSHQYAKFEDYINSLNK